MLCRENIIWCDVGNLRVILKWREGIDIQALIYSLPTHQTGSRYASFTDALWAHILCISYEV